MTTSIIVAVLLTAAIGFGMIFKKMRGKGFEAKTDDAPSPPPPKTDAPEVEFTNILDSLLKLNLMIRTDRGIETQMCQRIEAIIDDLKSVIPAMMERYPGEALTYELKKIGSAHLYNTVKEYLDLSPESRNNQRTAFEEIIGSLHDVSHRAREIVEKNETAEFKTMAHFLAGKFS